MDSRILKAAAERAWEVITQHAEEFEGANEDPLAVLQKYTYFPPKIGREVLENLHAQDKISILYDGEKILAVYPNKGLEPSTRKKPFRPNAVVFADVANICATRQLPYHRFPGEEISEQLRTSGFLVRARFACITTKALERGVTHFEIMSQVIAVSQTGFIPVVCPYLDPKSPSPDDDMIETLVESFLGHPDIETFIVVSGDRDFQMIKRRVEAQGHDFLVLGASSNMSKEWLERSRATMIALSPEEQEAYKFLEKRLKGLGEKMMVECTSQTEKTGVVFLHAAVNQMRHAKGAHSFQKFARLIWEKLSPDWQRLYAEEFLHRVLFLIASYTDLITTKHFYGPAGPGTSFAFNQQSKLLEFFQET